MKVKADLSQQVIVSPTSFSSNALNASGEIVNKIKVVTVEDHDLLLHRDFADQHPIEAITRLAQELAARPAEALSNMEIQNILNH